MDRVFSLARDYGAAVICLLIDERGQARDVEWKLEVAHRIHQIVEIPIERPPVSHIDPSPQLALPQQRTHLLLYRKRNILLVPQLAQLPLTQQRCQLLPRLQPAQVLPQRMHIRDLVIHQPPLILLQLTSLRIAQRHHHRCHLPRPAP